MARLPTFLSSETMTAGRSYFDYQRDVARAAIIPWLRRHMSLDGVMVGDFGAHQGGVLQAFREGTDVAGGVGVELNEQVVAASPFVSDERFRLVVGDLMNLDPGLVPFDLVLLHDVLEHVIDVDAAVRASVARLALGGRLFVVFPPYGSAFGGHQHTAAGWARAAPFLHFLPAPLFFRLARPGAGEYMTPADALEDMQSVRRTRLTLGKAERAFAAASLRIVASQFFVVRPEHSLRYGIRARSAGPLARLPLIREIAVSGAYYLLGQ